MEKPDQWTNNNRCVSDISADTDYYGDGDDDDEGDTSSSNGDHHDHHQQNQTHTKLQLHLHASNLPRVGLRKFPPDTFAIVTFVDDPRYSRGGNNSRAAGNTAADEQNTRTSLSRHYNAIESESYKTEIVQKSSHPQWTETIQFNYEYGKLQHFYIQVMNNSSSGSRSFSSSSKEMTSNNNNNNNNKKNMLGSALFEVTEILGTAGNAKVKRLRQGGCVFAHLQPITSTMNGGNSEITSKKKQLFVFQLYVLQIQTPGSIIGKRLPSLTSNPEIYIEIAKRQVSPSGRTWITVYRSRPIKSKSREEELISWDPSEIDLDILCNGNLDCPMRLSVWLYKSSKRDSVIGTCETTIQNMMNACINDDSSNMANEEERRLDLSMTLYKKNKRNTSSGREEVGKIGIRMADLVGQDDLNRQRLQQTHDIACTIRDIDDINAATAAANAVLFNESNNNNKGNNSRKGSSSSTNNVPTMCILPPPTTENTTTPRDNIHVSPTFKDYVHAGCYLDFVVAIDFTSSNGDPRIPGTRHYRSEDSLNDYEECITAIGHAISSYTSPSKESAVWGFGAKFGTNNNNSSSSTAVQHLFQCGPSNVVHGVDGILDAYQSVFRSGITMSGPTVLLQVLQAAAIRAKNFNQTKDSKPYCMLLILTDGVVNDINETKRKLGVYSKVPLSVVIVGIGNTCNFQQMYTLNNRDKSTNRRNTTFVECRHYQNNPNALATSVFQDIPNQIVQYYTANGIYPS